MILYDKNLSWKPPNGVLTGVRVDGAFLIVSYDAAIFETGTITEIGVQSIEVYLNDQGREVLRVQWETSNDATPLMTPAPEQVRDWSDNAVGRAAGHVQKLPWYKRFLNWYDANIAEYSKGE